MTYVSKMYSCSGPQSGTRNTFTLQNIPNRLITYNSRKFYNSSVDHSHITRDLKLISLADKRELSDIKFKFKIINCQRLLFYFKSILKFHRTVIEITTGWKLFTIFNNFWWIAGYPPKIIETLNYKDVNFSFLYLV